MTDIIERLRIESQREPHEPIWRDAIDEIEALRAEVAEWKRVAAAQAELHGEAEAENELLLAERDALARDAARYRWLRDGASEQSEQSDPWDSVGHIQPPLVCLKPGLQVAQTGHDLDAAIDAELAKVGAA